MSGEFTSIEDAHERLAGVGYLADEPASLVSFLAGKPVPPEQKLCLDPPEFAATLVARVVTMVATGETVEG